MRPVQPLPRSASALEVEATRIALNRAGILILFVALSLISLAIVQQLYRYSLPTDGWYADSYGVSQAPTFNTNFLDAPSALHEGDRLVAVNGVPYQRIIEQVVQGEAVFPETYQAGKTVRYTVLRGEKELDITVPLYPGSSISFTTILHHLFDGIKYFVVYAAFWLFLLISGFVSPKTRNNLSAQLFFLLVSVSVASGIHWNFVPVGVADVLFPFSFHMASFLGGWIHLAFAQPLSLHIILSFPEPRRFLHWRWSLVLIYGPLFVLNALFVARPNTDTAALVIFMIYNLVNIVLVVRMLLTKWSPEQTLQVRWFGFGYALYFLGMVLTGITATDALYDGLVWNFGFFLSSTAFLFCIATAILRHRLFDINVIINRTLVYGGLSLVVVGAYALIVGGLGSLIHAQDTFGLSLLATGLIAVAFNPLRERLQRETNRFLYGYRDEPYKVLAQFGETLEGALLPTQILPLTVETIAKTLKLPFVRIAIPQADNLQIVATAGVATQVEHFPLSYAGEPMGELCVSPREGQHNLDRADRVLLTDLARQIGIAIHALLLQADLERSKLRVITAREEARKRLGNDLHDSVGHSLARLMRHAEGARRLLLTNPDQAKRLLADINLEGSAAIAHVRSLAHSLHPPDLEVLGFLGSLREWAAAESSGMRVGLELPATLPRLSAAVEVAAYSIVREALYNASRHAAAATCTVRVCLSRTPLDTSVLTRLNVPVLELDICDDGTGFAEPGREGLGLLSMRERATEVGGTFDIASSPRGTRVSARLPCWEGETRG